MTARSTIIDKHGALRNLAGDQVSVELGCGTAKRDPTAIGIDVLDTAAVDVVGDAREVLAAMPPASVHTISSFHFLEHVEDLEGLLREVDRVLAPGGCFVAVVPHFANPYYYSDYTHVRFFGLYTFSYLCAADPLRRKVPKYDFVLPWRIDSVRLRLNSDPAFPARQFVRKLLGLVIKRSYRLMELYEDVFCWILPCYEIEWHITKDI